jgi:hypothetical protein
MPTLPGVSGVNSSFCPVRVLYRRRLIGTKYHYRRIKSNNGGGGSSHPLKQ